MTPHEEFVGAVTCAVVIVAMFALMGFLSLIGCF